MDKPTNAFVLRQSPSGVERLESISLPENVVVAGWSDAPGLLKEKDYLAFRDIIRRHCYPEDTTLRKAGYAAGTMWRFISEMKVGDWVVVPHWGGVFYVAAVRGDAYWDDSQGAISTDSCYRRSVQWLNDKKAIPRRFAKSKLFSRMKTQQTSAGAQDLIDEIHEALLLAGENAQEAPGTGSERLFAQHLRLKMVQAVLREIYEGYMDERKFEELVERVLKANGAKDTRIIPRISDKGVDILATFQIGSVTEVPLAVQVKYHREMTDNSYIDALKKGMEQEDLSVGWFVTSGVFAEDAPEYLEKLLAGSGMQVSLIDGEQLAGMIIDSGLGKMLLV